MSIFHTRKLEFYIFQNNEVKFYESSPTRITKQIIYYILSHIFKINHKNELNSNSNCEVYIIVIPGEKWLEFKFKLITLIY